ncbi:hyaluronidase-2 isoform X2 [Mastacembelus armatus]|uniref:hyaluronidase-2 isoform X2 n=1 Tax=Mastacembelus armatus TaxID=205130 RepID=UPI000E453CBC|nr:hyaluronidase-2-like isoform X2 [Mastacembelus armatus]
MDAVLHPVLATAGQLPWLLLTVFTAWTVLCSADPKQTRWPLYSQKPILLAWNAPTEGCAPRHSVTLSLKQFDIVASPNEGFVRQNLTIFYKERLGLYPYYKHGGTAVNGGLPQLASLTQHYEKMPYGLRKYIREPDAKGLAVIDWEEWRPLWIRNWDIKDIYRNKSREMVAKKNPKLTQEQVGKVAEQEFELSARKFMLDTLKLAKSLRPNQLWGFYLFPDCYNHDYKSDLKNYTGRCPAVEISRNDQLNWLWMMDLVSTIGESVALGAAGVIFWGDTSYANSTASCSTLNKYLQGPLGRYLLNVSTAAEQCSKVVCKSQGRCLRRVPDSDVYLHLSSLTHSITSQDGQLKVTGVPGKSQLALFHKHFQCQCYSGYTGETCAQKEKGQNRASSVLGIWPLCLLLPLGLLTLLH